MFRPGAAEMSLPCISRGKLRAGGDGGGIHRLARAFNADGARPASHAPHAQSLGSSQSLHALNMEHPEQ